MKQKIVSVDEIIEREKLDINFVRNFLRDYFTKNRVSRLMNGHEVVADFVPDSSDLEYVVDHFPKKVYVVLNQTPYGGDAPRNTIASFQFPEEIDLSREELEHYLNVSEILEETESHYPTMYIGHYCLYWFKR